MRNFVCPNCGEKILQHYVPTKSWFVFGVRNNCTIHESIVEFDTQDEALEYLSNTPSLHESRFISDDTQK